MEYAIVMRGITKRFGTLMANERVDLHVRAGSLHAIVGENGAGKTTLMRILYGYYAPDEGEIYLRGKPVRFASPADAIAHGIGMVSQHYSIIPELSVLDNLMLGQEVANRLGILNRPSRSPACRKPGKKPRIRGGLGSPRRGAERRRTPEAGDSQAAVA
jgi:general nucleoside transport system ATP-binding protein